MKKLFLKNAQQLQSFILDPGYIMLHDVMKTGYSVCSLSLCLCLFVCVLRFPK